MSQLGDFLRSLRPLQIYTALKPSLHNDRNFDSLRPLQIYTALKRRYSAYNFNIGLRPLQIYTALKLMS